MAGKRRKGFMVRIEFEINSKDGGSWVPGSVVSLFLFYLDNFKR